MSIDQPRPKTPVIWGYHQKLQEWLKDYSLGELWEKNVFGGRPSNG